MNSMQATSQTLYMPIASPPTPVPSPGPCLSSLSSTSTSIRRQYLTSILATCTPSELLFISTTIAPLLKRDFLRDLPAELGLYIIGWIDEPKTLARAMRVSRYWQSLIRDDSVWRRMCQVWVFGNIAEKESMGDVVTVDKPRRRTESFLDEEQEDNFEIVDPNSQWSTRKRKPHFNKPAFISVASQIRPPVLLPKTNSFYAHFKYSYTTSMVISTYFDNCFTQHFL